MTHSHSDPSPELIAKELNWLREIFVFLTKIKATTKTFSLFGFGKTSETQEQKNLNQLLELDKQRSKNLTKIDGEHKAEFKDKVKEKQSRDLQNQLNAFYLQLAEEFLTAAGKKSNELSIDADQLEKFINKINYKPFQHTYLMVIGFILSEIVKMHQPEFLETRGLTLKQLERMTNPFKLKSFFSEYKLLTEGPKELVHTDEELIALYFQKELHCLAKPYVSLQKEEMTTVIKCVFELKDDYHEAMSRLQISERKYFSKVKHQDFQFEAPVNIELHKPLVDSKPYYLNLRVPNENFIQLLNNMHITLQSYSRALHP